MPAILALALVVSIPGGTSAQENGDVVEFKVPGEVVSREEGKKPKIHKVTAGFRAGVIERRGKVIYVTGIADSTVTGWTKVKNVKIVSPEEIAPEKAGYDFDADQPGPAPEPESASSAPVTRDRPLRVAVTEIKSTELLHRQTALFTAALAAEIRKIENVTAVSMDEIKAMLTVEKHKMMLGCIDDKCIAEIAGALGVDFLIIGSLGSMGGSTVLMLRRISMHTGEAAATFSRQMKGGGGEEFLQAIGPGVEQLFPGFALLAGEKRGVRPEVVARWNPPPLPTWVFWSSAGLTAAAGSFTAVAFVLQRGAEADFNDLAGSSVYARVQAYKVRDAEQSAETWHTVKLASLITFGGLVLVTGTFALLTDWRGEPEPVKAKVLIPAAAWSPEFTGLIVAGAW